MKRRICSILALLLLFQVFVPLSMNGGNLAALSFAESTDLFLWTGTNYYMVKGDLSSFSRISRETYEKHHLLDENPVVRGIEAVQVTYEQKDRDIYARGVKIFTLEKDPVDAVLDVHYNVSSLYEIKTKDNRLFYYIINDNGIVNPNSYGDTDDLVEVKDGKVIHHIKVYNGLEYINSDVWRSTACFSGAGYYALTQHSISGKFKDINMRDLVSDYALKHGQTFKPDSYDVTDIGTMEKSIFFGLKCRDKNGVQLPLIKVYEVTVEGTVRERRETSKSLFNNMFIHDYTIYSLDQEGQVLRRLSDLRSVYLNGSATNLGTFVKTKKTAFSAKLPVYDYQKQEYICLEDLTLLGYSMKWDSKKKVGHWTYTGKKTGKPHVFKKNVIYDNDVFATIKGRYVHIYNVEGYSLINLMDLDGSL